MGSHHSSRLNSKKSLKSSSINEYKDSQDSKIFEYISVNNIYQEHQLSESSFCSSYFNNRSGSSCSIPSNSFNEKNKKSDEISLPTVFFWDQGGSKVNLSGDFTSWKNEYKMTYNKKENNFSIMLFLNKGVYQFRFLVDGKWKVSERYNTIITKSGNLNNIIDNSEEVKKMDNFIKEYIPLSDKKSKSFEQENKTHISGICDNKSKDNHLSNIPIRHNPLKRIKDISNNRFNKNLNKIPYGNDFPKEGYLIERPPSVPYTYSKPIRISSYDNDELIGNVIQTFPNTIKKIYEQNESYKSIKLPSHVNINHILSSCVQYNNFYSINSTLRIGKKFCTIIYCEPYINEIRDIEYFNNSDNKLNFMNNNKTEI